MPYPGNLNRTAVTSFITLFFCEFISRFFLDPVDYLSPRMVNDSILGHKIVPGSAGHDLWGFRNKEVPDSVDVVAIGDSQTFGNNAKLNQAWPKALQQILGKKVYNLSLGGYGPNQYYHLLKNQALKLKPSVVICGFYMGNDLFDSFQYTYDLDYWSYLRDSRFCGDDISSCGPVEPEKQKIFGNMRDWLSRNSVVYRIVVHGPILGNMKRRVQAKNAVEYDKFNSLLEIKEKNIYEVFMPKYRLSGLNLDKDMIKEGLRISLELFREMHLVCKQNNIDFYVLFIPTKESVYCNYLENNIALNNSEMINALIWNERKIVKISKGYFNKHNVQYQSCPVNFFKKSVMI